MSTTTAAWLAAIIESSDDAIVTKTLEGVVLTWNPGAERVFGYSADEMMGQSITMLFPPERLAEEGDLLRRLAQGQRIEHFETVRVRKDGRRINISVTLSPIRDENGRVVAVSKVARDITERKVTEALLGERLQWLQATLTSVGQSVIAVDAQARISFMNPAAATLTGWTSEQAVGRPLDAIVWLVEEGSRRRVDNPAISALTQGHGVTAGHQALLISKDGLEYPIEASAAVIHDERGTVFGAAVILHDVTDLRRAAQSQSRLSAIVESADDAIVSKTLEGVVLTWNPAAERLFGYSATEVIGRPITMLFPPERLAEEAEFLTRVAQGQRIEHFETVRVRKDGTPINVSVSLSPIHNAVGRIVGVSKIARDITGPKRMELERAALLEREQRALRESVAANRSKDEFIAMLSHELRTPINAILGWSQLLSSGRLRSPESTRAVEVITRNARLQAQLIDELLDLSAVMVGKVKLDVGRSDLVGVVRAAIDSIGPAATIKELQLDVRIDDDHIPVMGDATRLQQVVWNLLTNAVKFTPSGGRIEIVLTRHETFARLLIADTGVGIAQEVLPTIFDRFRQADASTTRRHGGLGLGLAIVRHLVELHGGSVWAESDGVGCGAKVTVELPLLRGSVHGIPAMVASAATATRDRPALTGVRILVVEDNEDARQLLGHVLNLEGAVVSEANSGADALKVVKDHAFDVLIADIGMPDMDGYELLQELQRVGRAPAAIAVTAYATETDRRRALKAGFLAHLGKPIAGDELLQAIAQILGRRPALSATETLKR